MVDIIIPNPKQIEVFQSSKARISIYEGAVRSGKSTGADFDFGRECRVAPEGSMFISGKSQGTIKRNVIDEMYNIFGTSYVKYYPGKQEATILGRHVYCIGANDERAEAKIRGGTFSGGLIDEGTLIPKSFFNMCLSRLSRPNSRLIVTTNPDGPFHWLKKDYMDRQSQLDLQVFSFKLEDNPSLPPSYVENIKKEYRGLWYKRYIEGQWVLAEGSVYDFFSEEEHVIEIAPTYAKYWLAGIDYGTGGTTAFVLVGFNDEMYPNMWVEKEYYFNCKEAGYQKTDNDFADDFAKFIQDYGVKSIYIDPSATSLKVELRRRKIQAQEAKNDVLNGIRVVASHLSSGNLKIKSVCRNLIQEFQSYVWDSKKSEKGIDEPVKQFDHALDALRYAIFSHFGEKMTLKTETLDQKQQKMYQKMYQSNPAAYPGWGWGWQKM